MKYIFILLLLSLLVSCFEDKENEEKETDPCKNVNCEEYQQCIKGTCVKKQGRCATNDDCLNNQICNQNYVCADDVDVCENVLCSSHGTCKVSEINRPYCECDEGYSVFELECVANVDVCEGILCSSHGTCKVSEINEPYCECEEGYSVFELECVANNVNCIEGDEKTIECGLNSNGEQTQKCENDIWVDFGNCLDPDICENLSIQNIPCGINGLGELEQECVDGNWIDISSCSVVIKEEYFHIESKIDDMFIKDNIIYTISTILFPAETLGTFQKQLVISKKDLNLNNLGSLSFGTPQDDFNGKIFVDDSGLIYIAGSTTGSFDADFPNRGGIDYFIAKFDNSLELQFVISNGSEETEEVSDLIVKDDYVYVAVNSNGLFFEITGGDYNGFLLQYDKNYFELSNAYPIYTDLTDKITGIAFDDKNEIYITGTTNGQLAHEMPSEFDIFLIKLTNNFELKYTKYFGSFGKEIPVAIKYFGGNIYITGTTDSANFYGINNSGLKDIFLMKIDKDLTPESKIFGTTQNDIPADLTINKFGDIFISGYTQRISSLTGLLNYDSVLLKYSTNLQRIYSEIISANIKNNTEDDSFYSIISTDDKVFIGGSTNGYFIDNDESDTANLFTIKLNNPKSCVPLELRTVDCSDNDLLIQSIKCVNSDWEVVDSCYSTPCANTELFYESCGMNGRGKITYTCTNNQYILSEACVDPDNCVDNGIDLSVCGYHDMGEQLMTCFDGTLSPSSECSVDLKQFGTDLIDEGKVITSNFGFTYVAGVTTGSFGGTQTNGQNDIVIIQFDNTNVVSRTVMLGTSGNDSVTAMVTDTMGNVFITGQTTINFETDISLQGPTTYVAKYDSSLTREWVRYYFDASDTKPYDMIMYNNSIYIVGEINGSEGTEPPYGAIDILLFKIDTAGNLLQQAYQFGSAGNDKGISIKIKDDVIYVAGETDGDITGENNTASPAGFLLKLDVSLNFQDVKQFKSDGTSTNVKDIVINSNNNLYVAGYETGNWNSETNNGMGDIYIAKFDNDFNFQQVKLLGTFNDDRTYGLEIDVLDNLHLIYSSNAGMETHTGYNIYDSIFTLLKEEMFMSSDTTVANDIFSYNNMIFITGYTDGDFPETASSGGKDIFVFSKK